MSGRSFLQRALTIHPSGVAAVLFGSYMNGGTRNCCHLGAFCVHHHCHHRNKNSNYHSAQTTHIQLQKPEEENKRVNYLPYIDTHSHANHIVRTLFNVCRNHTTLI